MSIAGDTGSAASAGTARSTRSIILVMVAVASALVVGLIGGRVLAPAPALAPTEASVDAGFARDMQAHHAQAVQMSLLVLNSSQDEAVRQLASDILLTQQNQAGQLYGWLESWGLPQASAAPAMAWMGSEHSGHGGEPAIEGGSATTTMPGMATPEQLRQLQTADPETADRLYLQLMIPHHRGGVEMAQAAVAGVQIDAVRRLAQTMVASQTAEIDLLQRMLAERGGTVAGS